MLGSMFIQCGPENKVQERADRHAEGGVDPEYPLHGVEEPWASIWDAILAGID